MLVFVFPFFFSRVLAIFSSVSRIIGCITVYPAFYRVIQVQEHDWGIEIAGSNSELREGLQTGFSFQISPKTMQFSKFAIVWVRREWRLGKIGKNWFLGCFFFKNLKKKNIFGKKKITLGIRRRYIQFVNNFHIITSEIPPIYSYKYRYYHHFIDISHKWTFLLSHDFHFFSPLRPHTMVQNLNKLID